MMLLISSLEMSDLDIQIHRQDKVQVLASSVHTPAAFRLGHALHQTFIVFVGVWSACKSAYYMCA